LRNVLTAYLRRESLSREQIVEILDAADQALAGSEHIIADQLVLDVVEGSTLTAYDAEFVALASALSVPLVTSDKAVLKAFPDRAMTMEAFVSR
jgi:predicted nucleic acid-binding protein